MASSTSIAEFTKAALTTETNNGVQVSRNSFFFGPEKILLDGICLKKCQALREIKQFHELALIGDDMRRFTLQFEKISLAAAVAYVLVLAVGLGEATLLAQENDSEKDAEWLSHFRCKQCGHLLESDLPFGVFTEEEIEKFRSVPVLSLIHI